jgi:hypothetical protein
MSAEAPTSRLGLFAVVRLIDRLSVGLDLVIALFNFLQDVAHLVHPATLIQSSGIKPSGWQFPTWDNRRHNQLEMLAL